MAKAKKTTPKTPKKTEEPLSKKGRNGYTLKVPEGMTFEELLKLAINTPPLKKKK